MQTNEKDHLETRIRMTEDSLLRTKDPYETEKLNGVLIEMRKHLQKLQWEERA